MAGLHQHFFESATATFTAAAGELLFVWVWRGSRQSAGPADDPVAHRHERQNIAPTWGLSRIGWGARGPPRRRVAAIPRRGRWVRLEVPVDAASGGTSPAPPSAAWHFPSSSTAARPFGAAGAISAANAEQVWFSGRPAGRRSSAVSGSCSLARPARADHRGDQRDCRCRCGSTTTRARTSLGAGAAQIFQRGLEGFIAYLRSRADRADDLVDYNFVRYRPTSTRCANWCSAPPSTRQRYRQRWRASSVPRPRWPRPSASRLLR